MVIRSLAFKLVQRKSNLIRIEFLHFCFLIFKSEQSIIWIYWCPTQYVKSIRHEILTDH